MKKLACIILAAGEGTRLHSNIPKALHEICGEPIIVHILNTVEGLITARMVIVVGFRGEKLETELKQRKMTDGVRFALQKERLGTGHAVMVAKEYLKRYRGDVLVLVGDAPLLSRETLHQLLERHRRQEAAATVLTTDMENPTGYGRVLRHQDGSVLKIVEDKDANIYEQKVKEVNTGTYVFDAAQLFKAIDEIRPENEQGEYYLPDVIQIMVNKNLRVEALVTPDPSETQGINNRRQFAQAERIMRNRILDRLMAQGVTIVDPPSTFIDHGVEIGIDTIIQPNTHIRGHAHLGADCVIGPMTQIDDSEIGNGAIINSSQLFHCRIGMGCQITSSFLRESIIPDKQTIGPFANLQGGREVNQTGDGESQVVPTPPGRKRTPARAKRSRRQKSHAKR